MRWSPDQIGVEVTIEEVVEALNSTVSGTFAYVAQYQDKKGNVSSQLFRAGSNYGNMKDSSLVILEGLRGHEGRLEVTFWTWLDSDRTCNSRKAKGRLFSHETRRVNWRDDRVQILIRDIENGIRNPRTTGKADYEKEGKSLYSLDDKLYIRDALQLNSVYHEELSEQAKAELEVQGVTTRPSATDVDGAIKKHIRDLLPVGHYRTFFFDLGKFAYVAVGNKVFLSNEAGGIFEALPEYAKANIAEEVSV